jgi:2',3'-cyclic-nucleotide 2'-phosphodiesterase (5'-nucleotidase family)
MKLTIKFIAISILLTFISFNSFAQDIRFEWRGSRVLMDSTLNYPEEPKVLAIIEKFKPSLDSKMQQVIGVSEAEMRSGRPESLLSNFAVDALLEFSQNRSERGVDFALTNFGGIRASLPGGDVRLYDIFSIFPFENYIVILDMEGKSVRKLFESFARNRVEAFSDSVRLIIDEEDGEIEELLINGKELDDNMIYRVATIDFLLSGGDNVVALKDAVKIEETGALIRDAIIEKIRKQTERGEKISSSITGRVKYED